MSKHKYLDADKEVFDTLIKKSVTSPIVKEPTIKSNLQIVNYNDSELSFDDKDETIWGTQDQISKLFDLSVSSVSEHIKKIYNDQELAIEDTFRKFRNVSNQPIQHYNLDMIIAIGYRVNSKKATEFRRWATEVLKQFIKDGYVIDQERLREDPEKLAKLAAEIRALRAEEKNIYHSVRECFKMSSSDYNPGSQEVKSFYALLQDKFHHAITQSTSSKLIMDRADHRQQNMGIQTIGNSLPTKAEAKIGKNYLTSEEIYRMHLLSEQFLLYAESTALMGKKMTMKLLIEQLDNLLQLNGYPVFDGYKDYLKDKAIEHANQEYLLWEKVQKLKFNGVNVDLVLFENGEYEEQCQALEYIPLSKLQKQFEESQIKKIEVK